jgi:hypothetical protein
MTETGGRFGASREATTQLALAVLEWFERVAPAFRTLAKVLRGAAAVGAAASVIIVGVLIADAWPLNLSAWIIVLVLLGIFLLGPFGVWRFSGGLIALAELPGWLRSTPGMVDRYRNQLAEVYRDTIERYGDTPKFKLFSGGLVRAAKVALAVKKDFVDYEGLTGLASWFYLIWAFLGLLQILFEVFLLPFVVAGVLLIE